MILDSVVSTILAQTADAAGAATQPGTQPAAAAAEPEVSALDQAASMLGPTLSQTTLTGWLILFSGIFVGLLAGKVVQATLRGIAERLKQRGWIVRSTVFRSAAGPANLALFAIGLRVGTTWLYFEEASRIREHFGKFILLLYIIAIGWFLYNVVDLIELALRRMTAKSATMLDDTVVTLLRKALRIFLLIMLVLFVAQNVFDQNITAWLAGLGIAGLAVSLAAQDSIKNLFGSITVLLSRPFGLGDRIVFGAYDGTVENISFRDTKIRTLAGHLVTVPNMKFTDSTVENITARPFIARTIDLGLTYDTPPTKITQALKIIRDILADPEFADEMNVPDRGPRVYFKDFGSEGLVLQISYSYVIKAPGRDWWTYMSHAERLNLRLLDALNSAEIDMAYPSQTLYLAGDPRRQLSIRVLQDAGALNAS